MTPRRGRKHRPRLTDGVPCRKHSWVRLQIVVVIVAGLVVGCGAGDDRGAATDAGSTASPFASGTATARPAGSSGDWQRTRYCESDEKRRTTCGLAFDEASCMKHAACYEKHLRAEAKRSLAACLAVIPCNSNDDDCFAAAGAAYAGNAAYKAFAAACMTRIPVCMPTRDPQDTAVFCGTNTASMTDADLADFQRCLEMPCDAMATCLDEKWKELDGC
jgi:hypothetical protein